MKSEKKSKILRFVVFLAINFGALAIGGLFTGKGVPSDWYQNLDKAPWTPPGWIFGAAWTTIMIFFSVYMMAGWESIQNRKLLHGLFILQWVLNVSWNPTFFHFHQIFPALIIISSLTALTGFFLLGFRSDLKLKSLLVLPYFIWLIIATSLNGFIFFNNP